jgi:hypothetical protein
MLMRCTGGGRALGAENPSYLSSAFMMTGLPLFSICFGPSEIAVWMLGFCLFSGWFEKTISYLHLRARPRGQKNARVHRPLLTCMRAFWFCGAVGQQEKGIGAQAAELPAAGCGRSAGPGL